MLSFWDIQHSPFSNSAGKLMQEFPFFLAMPASACLFLKVIFWLLDPPLQGCLFLRIHAFSSRSIARLANLCFPAFDFFFPVLSPFFSRACGISPSVCRHYSCEKG